MYNYKNDRVKHYGLIAQDVEPLFPELIYNYRGTKAINYTEMIPILLLKIKDLQQQIDELKKTNQLDE